MYGAALKGGVGQQYLIDLTDNSTTSRPSGPDSPFFKTLVARDRGITCGVDNPISNKVRRWAIRDLDGAVLLSVPYVPEGAANRYGSLASPTYSSDRTILCHAVGNDIVL